MEKKTIRTVPSMVIGMGVAGSGAAIYMSRMGVSPLCFEPDRIGGTVIEAPRIDDYAGFRGVKGSDLAKDLEAQIQANGIEVLPERVVSLYRENDGTLVAVTPNGQYRAYAVVIASGLSHPLLQWKEDAAASAFVSYRPVTDAQRVAQKVAMVWGNTDHALSAVIHLSQTASKVIWVHRDTESIAKSLLDQAKAIANVESLVGYVEGISAKAGRLEASVRLDSGQVLPVIVDALFPLLGAKYRKGATDFLSLHEIQDDQDNIAVDRSCKTFIPGVFACGDVMQKAIRNIASSVEEGALAGVMAYRYIEELRKDGKLK